MNLETSRRVNGVIVKINTIRSELGLRKISYEEWKPTIAKALRAGKWICPLCLNIVSTLVYARLDKGWLTFETKSVCRKCFKKITAKFPLEKLVYTVTSKES